MLAVVEGAGSVVVSVVASAVVDSFCVSGLPSSLGSWGAVFPAVVGGAPGCSGGWWVRQLVFFVLFERLCSPWPGSPVLVQMV